MKKILVQQFRRWRPLLACLPLVSAEIGHATMIFDRGLPLQNVNPAAGSNRSNSAAAAPLVGGTPSVIVGDDFVVPSAGFSYFSGHFIQAFRFWVVTNYENPGAGRGLLAHLGDAIQRLDIWFGDPATPLPLLHSVNLTPGSNATGNPNVTITPVQYPTVPPENYIGGTGVDRQIFQIDVTGLNQRIYDGDARAFASFGASVPDASYLMYLHVSNGILGGNTMPSLWNGRLMLFDPLLLSLQSDETATGILGAPTDVNVQVFGVAVPEPAAYAFLLASAALTLALRRRAT